MGEKAKSGSWKTWVIAISVLSVVIIAASVIAVVLNAGKNAPASPEQQNPLVNGLILLSPEESAKNGKIIEEINDYIFPMTLEEAASYVDRKAEEYRGENVGLPVAQIKVNMFYNALQYEKAEEYGREIEEKYDLNKYPTTYQLDFYAEMIAIYEALDDEEKAKEYEEIHKNLSDTFYTDGGITVYGDD